MKTNLWHFNFLLWQMYPWSLHVLCVWNIKPHYTSKLFSHFTSHLYESTMNFKSSSKHTGVCILKSLSESSIGREACCNCINCGHLDLHYASRPCGEYWFSHFSSVNTLKLKTVVWTWSTAVVFTHFYYFNWSFNFMYCINLYF